MRSARFLGLMSLCTLSASPSAAQNLTWTGPWIIAPATITQTPFGVVTCTGNARQLVDAVLLEAESVVEETLLGSACTVELVAQRPFTVGPAQTRVRIASIIVGTQDVDAGITVIYGTHAQGEVFIDGGRQVVQPHPWVGPGHHQIADRRAPEVCLDPGPHVVDVKFEVVSFIDPFFRLGRSLRVGTDAEQSVSLTAVGVWLPPVSGACCFKTGACADLLPDSCDYYGGIYQGDGTTCATTVCDSIPSSCFGARDRARTASRKGVEGASFQRRLDRLDPGAGVYGLSGECNLHGFNICSGWNWIFNDARGAEWGHLFDPNDCPGGCLNGGAVSEVILYSSCSVVPGDIGGVRIDAVDANGCRTALLCDSGPLELTHCVGGDRWTVIPFDPNDCHLNGNPFAVSVVWGTEGEVHFATDNGLANLCCSNGVTGTFPGCFSTVPSCPGWIIPTQATFVFVTDFNGDTFLDDLCKVYGAPYPLSFPYVYGYGYLPNNLMVGVRLDCSDPTSAERTSWGRVKSLYAH